MKKSILFIRKRFKKENYILLENNYINSNVKMKYICPNGHYHSISWANWQQGKRCPYCCGNVRLTVEFIEEEFEEENYILLTKDYKNSRQKLKYICPEGHTYQISWDSWKQGFRCLYCSGKAKHTINYIKDRFEKEGYKLLSNKYKNSYKKLYYICRNGHKGNITWGSWSQGNRCPKCFFIKNSGENHPNWKGGISCEPYCDIWLDKEFKKSIKERDGYKCLNPDCWGNIHRLNIHHIDYNKKNCEPQNLITLCASCNSRANKDREWHKAWYKAILHRRYTT